eukprot:2049148-Rhodomonas_salina.1
MRTPNYNPLYSRGGQQDDYQRVPSFVGGVVNSVNSGQVVDSGGVNGVNSVNGMNSVNGGNGWLQQKGGILRVGVTE